jgi:hypothetical protein
LGLSVSILFPGIPGESEEIMKKIKEFYVPIWFTSVWFEGVEEVRLRTSDGHQEMKTSPVCGIEFKGRQATNGYTIEVETRNTVYILKDFPEKDYFRLMKNCPEEFRGKEWCDIELATV